MLHALYYFKQYTCVQYVYYDTVGVRGIIYLLTLQ